MGEEELKWHQLAQPSASNPAKDLILVHTVQLQQPMICIHFNLNDK